MKIENIIALARKCASRREKVKIMVDLIHEEQQAALNKHKAELRAGVRQANDAQAELATAIADHPELFVEPRTMTADGIRFGMTTSKAQVEIIDLEFAIERLRTQFPALALHAINVKETVNKPFLINQTDDVLKTIGATRVPGDPNTVVIKATDSEVDKLVARLLEKPEEAARELVA